MADATLLSAPQLLGTPLARLPFVSEDVRQQAIGAAALVFVASSVLCTAESRPLELHLNTPQLGTVFLAITATFITGRAAPPTASAAPSTTTRTTTTAMATARSPAPP